MEQGGAEAAAGEAEGDAASLGRRRFGFGVGDGEVGVGRHGSGGMLAAAAKTDEHLDDAGERVLRAGGVGLAEVDSRA